MYNPSKQVAATQDLGLEDLPLPALFAGAMLLPRDQVTAKMLKDLLTKQVSTFSVPIRSLIQDSIFDFP